VSLKHRPINTEDQTISQTIDNQTVIELPRDSRNVYTFLYLDPNVTQSAADDLSNSSGRRATARVFLSMGSGRMAAFSANQPPVNPLSKRLVRLIF